MELKVSRWIAGPTRLPPGDELERLGPMLERVGERAGIDPRKLVVRVQDDGGVSAGAGHLMFVTRREDEAPGHIQRLMADHPPVRARTELLATRLPSP